MDAPSSCACTDGAPNASRFVAGLASSAYVAAAFIGAFLLFVVQPMVSKAILPVYGGSSLVWGACMVFFQGALLAGYAISLWTHRKMGLRRAMLVHLFILATPLLFLPLDVSVHQGGTAPPGARLLVAWLFRRAALAAVALSTVSLVLQRWVRATPGRLASRPHLLYAASNTGSISALLLYPFVLEPFLDLSMQAFAWSLAYVVLLVLLIASLPRRGHERDDDVATSGFPVEIRPSAYIRWFLLSFASCALLLAATNRLSFDLASIPFLWVLPLSVYLGCFVVSFGSRPPRQECTRRFFGWALTCGGLLCLVSSLRMSLPAPAAVLLHLAVLGGVCLGCTESLVRSRPGHAQGMTSFYLAVAAGGFAGSFLVAWVAPLCFKWHAEYPVALALAAWAVSDAGSRRAWVRAGLIPALVAFGSVTIVPLTVRQFLPGAASGLVMVPAAGLPLALALRRGSSSASSAAAVLAAVALGLGFTESAATGGSEILRLRNYYGTYRVFEDSGLRYLQHGNTQHGRQRVAGDGAGVPLSYYHPSTPAGDFLSSRILPGKRAAMVGLGTGALAAYSGSGSVLDIYELDPANEPVARKYFSYLGDAEERGALVRLHVCDGRLGLASAAKASYDVIIVDAFSSGSVPVHLLTKEAFETYRGAMNTDGICLMHLSNRALNMVPFVASTAAEAGLTALTASNAGNVHPDADLTEWVALINHSSVDLRRALEMRGWVDVPGPLPRPWTDNYSNLAAAWLAGFRQGK
ncbi:MAG: hypothetical protein FJ224_00615 [Lentisphaerae bacterium]|nr:hypothetical protein [Lentisphaerota bacterium]